MKVLNSKKLTLVIWIVLTILSFSVIVFTAYSIISFLDKDQQNLNKIRVSAWSGSGTSGDPYQISSSTDWNTLAENVANGTTYSGTYFILTSNVSFTKKTFKPIGINSESKSCKEFQGKFNGNGKKLYSITYVDDGLEIDDYINHCVGVFGVLGNGAKIYDLMIDGFTCAINGEDSIATRWYAGLAGGITQSATVEISGCYVKDIRFLDQTNYGLAYSYISGIVGYTGMNNASIKISDCMVEGGYTNLPSYEAYPITCGYIRNNGYIKTCVYKSDLTNCIYNKSSYAYSGTATGCYNKVNSSGYTDLGASNSGESSGTTWYYYSDYSNWPFLRKFMSWSTFQFDTNGDDSYDTTDTIVVPSSLASNTITLIENNKTNATVTIIYKSVTASKSGWKFVEWEQIETYKYKAKFELETFTITFKACSNTDMTVDTSKTITAGTIIAITTTAYSSPNNNKYSVIKFSFKDSAGNDVQISYVSDSKYYITHNLSKTTISSNTEVRVTATLKTYYSQFG